MNLNIEDKDSHTKYHVTLLLRGFLILFLLAVFGSDAIGQQRQNPRGAGIATLPLQQLNLTQAQRNQIQEIRQQHGDSLRNAGQRIRQTKQVLEDAVRSEWFDESRIRSLSADLGDLQSEVAVLRGAIHAQTWMLLTSEQQARAGEIRTEMKARQQDRREAGRWLRERQESRRRPR